MHGEGAWVPDVIFGWDPMWMATVLLIVTYARDHDREASIARSSRCSAPA